MFPRPRRSQRGVALVITVVMLSVITFLTVAFLALMGREKGSVKTAVDQSTARLAADTALERAKAELLAGILATTNLANFDLLVSTNFVNWNGFDPNPAVVDQMTNVNYFYQQNGNPLTPALALQNLTNLFYSPPPPVFITNRMAANSMEFRHYLDLNRNGRLDLTGLWPATNALGGGFDTNGVATLGFNPPPNVLSNYVTGDPQWIGGLDRADKPHGPDNKFLYRYAYIAVPAGKTLDGNYLHNDAKTDVAQNGFFRNQGFGTWEMNLAGFFRDLNTNQWTYTLYSTNTYPGAQSIGTAYDDAFSFWRWRMGAAGQASVQNLFGGVGQAGFNTDFADGYTAGPLLTSLRGYTTDPDFANGTAATTPWPGADTENHYFTTQEFFDPTKTSAFFTNRLAVAGTNLSTYDRYTYYRMLSQLGTDSAPEDPGKLHLNYKNVNGFSATNFVAWTNATEFFTNVANQLLLAYTEDWLAKDPAYYANRFLVTARFGATNIPVFINGTNVYSAAVHRVLQLTANLWDAKGNTNVADGFPTVFLPLFVKSNNDIYVSGFRQISRVSEIPAGVPVDLTISTNAPTTNFFQVFGVPLVVGAVKGLPNFNEFASEAVVAITRKIQLIKSGPGGQLMIRQTNQVYDMNISIRSGVEFWNSYRSNYTRPVDIVVNSYASYVLTNDSNVRVAKGYSASVMVSTNSWKGWTDESSTSFIVPLRTNVSLFTPATVSYLPGSGTFTLPNTSTYDTDQRWIFPRWHLTVTNRLHAMILEQGTGRILDYVLLGEMNLTRNIGEMMIQAEADNPARPWWIAEPIGGDLFTGQKGIYQQIRASRGAIPGITDWNDAGSFTGNRPAEIAKFLAFFTPNGQASYSEGGTLYSGNNQSLVAYTPFNPTWARSIPATWQANDPLVHYIARDMFYTNMVDDIPSFSPPNTIITNYAGVKNVGALNGRYQPWGLAAADTFTVAMKDPLVRSSDDWEFPTNSLPTIGWLGRIHRGSPWQTVYLKSSDMDISLLNIPTNGFNSVTWRDNFTDAANRWAGWTGNQDLQEGFLTRPVSDRVLFDVLTAAPNDNATRGRLSVNQTNLAAWSALFSGLVVLSNANTDAELNVNAPLRFNPVVVNPVGEYYSLAASNWPPLLKIINGINAERTRTNSLGQFVHPGGYFERAADVLSAPELTVASPFLSTNGFRLQRGLNDAAYEWLPQQILPLLHTGEARFVIYAYGQSLQPAPNSIITAGGNYFGLCTNYTITAEVATRAVVRIEGSPNPRDANHPIVKKRYPPRVVVESFNFLPPE